MVFGSFGVFAQSAKWNEGNFKFEGSMICKIKDQIILATEDGISKRYAGVKGSFKIGDTIVFKYDFHGSTNTHFMNFRGMEIVTSFSKATNDFIPPTITSNKIRFKNFRRIDSEFSEDAILGKDEIFFQDSLNVRKLNLRRYYKNDWEGFYTGSFPRNFEAHSSTLDCRHEIDVIDEIIEKVKELYISKIDEK